MKVNEYLEIKEIRGDKVVVCTKCGHVLCQASENYKRNVCLREAPLYEAGPKVDRFRQATKFIFRQYCCPSCFRLFESEIALKGEPVLQDVELELNR